METPLTNYAYIAGALETTLKYLVSDLYQKGIVKDYDADKAEEFVADKIAYLYKKEREFSGVKN